MGGVSTIEIEVYYDLYGEYTYSVLPNEPWFVIRDNKMGTLKCIRDLSANHSHSITIRSEVFVWDDNLLNYMRRKS